MIETRYFQEEDRDTLERWRALYPRQMDMPHGYEGAATETCVAEKDGNILLSLTATVAVILDPLLRNPDADNGDVAKALQLAESNLTFLARKRCVEAYIAVPKELESYIPFVKKHGGYEETAQDCVILRKSLVKELPVDVT